jgi:hypothetical protein
VPVTELIMQAAHGYPWHCLCSGWVAGKFSLCRLGPYAWAAPASLSKYLYVSSGDWSETYNDFYGGRGSDVTKVTWCFSFVVFPSNWRVSQLPTQLTQAASLIGNAQCPIPPNGLTLASFPTCWALMGIDSLSCLFCFQTNAAANALVSYSSTVSFRVRQESGLSS